MVMRRNSFTHPPEVLRPQNGLIPGCAAFAQLCHGFPITIGNPDSDVLWHGETVSSDNRKSKKVKIGLNFSEAVLIERSLQFEAQRDYRSEYRQFCFGRSPRIARTERSGRKVQTDLWMID